MVTTEPLSISVCTFLSFGVEGKKEHRVYEVRSRESCICSIRRKQHVPYKQHSNERKERKQRLSARGAHQRSGNKPQNPEPEHRTHNPGFHPRPEQVGVRWNQIIFVLVTHIFV